MTEAPDNTPPVHAPMDQFHVDGGHLMIGGQRIVDLADRMGTTPFYAYSSELLRTRMADLRAAMPRDLHIHYAMKANPMPDVVSLMSTLTDGIDVASEREMHVALKTGIAPDQISFAGPGKRDAEIAAAIKAGIILNIESERERDTAISIGKQLGIRPNIAVRVNPDFELKGSGMRMGGGAKQFGIDVERVPDLLKTLDPDQVNFLGFHIFSGSNSLNASAIIEAQEKTFALARVLAPFTPTPIRKLNIGGGFGIPYFPGEKRLDITSIGAALSTPLSSFIRDFPGVRVNIELGRYLVGEAGLYVTRIIDRKISRGQVFLIVDGGLHHHLSASGNFGQVIRKNYPVAIANKMKLMKTEGPTIPHSTDAHHNNAHDSSAHVNDPYFEIASVVGPLCTPLDLLADKMMLPRADIGDLVVIYQSGAYGLTASPRGFLSHTDAGEVLV